MIAIPIWVLITGAALLIVALGFRRYLTIAWELVSTFTWSPWVILFERSYSTGNGAGAMGKLIALVIVACQFAVLVFAAIVAAIIHIL